VRSRDSVVGTATRYGLEGPGIESRWGEIFCTYPDRLRSPPSLLYNGYRVFPGNKGGRGVMLTTHPLLVPRLRKSWAIPPLTLWVLLGLLRSSLYLYPELREDKIYLKVRFRTKILPVPPSLRWKPTHFKGFVLQRLFALLLRRRSCRLVFAVSCHVTFIALLRFAF
jgi:hypothetical protein